MFEKTNIGPVAFLGWADISKGAAEGGGYNLVALQHALDYIKTGESVYYLQSGIHYSILQLFGLHPPQKIIHHGNPFGINHYILYNSSNKAPAIYNMTNRDYQLRDNIQNRMVINWLLEHKIRQICIHSLEGQSLDLIDSIKNETTIKVFVFCHDHFYLCPRVNFLYMGKEICLDYQNGKKCETCQSPGFAKNFFKIKAIEVAGNRFLNYIIKSGIKIKNYGKTIKSKHPESIKFNPLPLNTNELFLNNLSIEDSPFFAMFRRKKSIQSLQKADKVFTPSTFVAQSLIRCGLSPDKVSTFRIDLPHFKELKSRIFASTKKSNKIRFCFRGSSLYHKGLFVFLEALVLLSPQIKEQCHFLVRGHEDCSRLESYRKIIPQLELHSVYSPSELESFIKEYDIGILPHLWFENSPIVLLEHLASGKPVLVARLGGVTDFVREGVNGWFFPAGDVKGLAEKITHIVNDKLHLSLK